MKFKIYVDIEDTPTIKLGELDEDTDQFFIPLKVLNPNAAITIERELNNE